MRPTTKSRKHTKARDRGYMASTGKHIQVLNVNPEAPTAPTARVMSRIVSVSHAQGQSIELIVHVSLDHSLST